jgi:AraC-like DNA-binding protein
MVNWLRTGKLTKLDSVDPLQVRVCGYEQVEPGKVTGPIAKDRYSLHYIHKGKGKFEINGHTYNLSAGQGFLIVPNRIVRYEPDDDDPWSYSWIGFNGYKADSYLRQAGLSLNQPIFEAKSDDLIECFARMGEIQSSRLAKIMRYTSTLYLVLYHLIDQFPQDSDSRRDSRQIYIQTAMDFIADQYANSISIAEIAEHVGLDQSYLGAIFKSQVQMTLQQFLIQYRIERACAFMEARQLTINQIAHSVGYENTLSFSRTFRKIKGVSPSEYRALMKG